MQVVFPRAWEMHPIPLPSSIGRQITKAETIRLLETCLQKLNFLKHFTFRTSAGGTYDNYYYDGFATTPYENAENNHAANLYTET